MANLFAEAVTFKSWYMAYPRKMKPRDAEKAWRQTLKRGVTPQQIMLSTQFMIETEWRGRDKQFIPYPASFLRSETFNRESYEERTEALEDECERPFGRHLCTACPVDHEWTESGPAYNVCQNWELSCPVACEEMRKAIKST